MKPANDPDLCVGKDVLVDFGTGEVLQGRIVRVDRRQPQTKKQEGRWFIVKFDDRETKSVLLTPGGKGEFWNPGWQPDAAAGAQQRVDGGYTVYENALQISDADTAEAKAVAHSEGQQIFNPGTKRVQAMLCDDHPLRLRVIEALNERGVLRGGREPARACVLHSKRGCKRQAFHSDFDVNAFVGVRVKPCSVLLALEDHTTLHFVSGPVELSRGDIMMFEGDVVHAGSEYIHADNTRFFMYVGIPGVSAPENDTYPYSAMIGR